VIDSRTAQPITLSDLFTNQQDGLNRLSEQIKMLALGPGKVMPDEPANAPTPENFANWIPDADGMTMYFAPYQFGARNSYPITVPWPALTNVLAPSMVALTQG
jgi:Protein of unknown function (DUF3298)